MLKDFFKHQGTMIMTTTATRSFGYWVIRILLLMGIGLFIFIAITLLSYQWLGRAKQSSQTTKAGFPQVDSSLRSVNAARPSTYDTIYRNAIANETVSGTPTYGNYPSAGYAKSPTTVYSKLMNGNLAQTVSPSTTDFVVPPPSVAPASPPPGYQWQQKTFTVPGTSSMPGSDGPPNSGFQHVTQWELVPAKQGAGGEIGRDQRARVLAEQLHATPTSQRDEKKMDELRKILDQSFVSMQEAQEQRLAKLLEEVAKTKAVLEKRKANQEEIVERRMSELLGNPDTTKWDYEVNSASIAPPVPSTTAMLGQRGELFQLRAVPRTYLPIPSAPHGDGTTKPDMPVYNPYEDHKPWVVPGPSNVIPAPRLNAPETQLGIVDEQPSPLLQETFTPQATSPSTDIRSLGSRLLEAISDLKQVTDKTNDQTVASLRDAMRQIEKSWVTRSTELQSDLEELTKQIEELKMLDNREWVAGNEPIRQSVQSQIKILTKRKADLAELQKWMKDFELNQLAKFREPRKVDMPEPIVEPEKTPVDAPVPTDSK
jgi:hypothetical protein